ncbi:glutathione S-transferase N-terminal domain-containing protein [Jiella sp. MQZ9-1]|uniref:Glutathione S-transferase N-terminal domain-containing protein n=1 Tax=Jiella flava TaxID=2816857 RepID=A0A939JV40_9HYPH|nr:glutathione S-transferase N-terminal domain-containing protein [Jiella flava]MBO0661612.1 glutathione S-transferase N-terminal domain-containing protein [Jiella flava]MCD2470254.1 glutathione S-transferase N-terminal domain-containing protein [Jiella flava]
MKIWGRINSSNVRKVLWCAEELGLSYERIDAGGAFGVVETPAYRALNPNGRVPTLEDGDLVLWESNAIVRYLANRYGKLPFTPTDPARLAAADKWMDWASTSLAAPFRDVFWNVVRMTPETRDDAAIENGIAGCSALLAIADAALAKSPYLSGEDLGIGDIPLGAVAYAWFEMPINRPDLPHLAAWYGRLKIRPAYQKSVMTALT